MAIQTSGTTRISNAGQLQNIGSVDATTAATIAANAGGTDYELPPYETSSSDKNILFGTDRNTTFGAGGWRGTNAYTTYGDSTADNMIIADTFGGNGGSNQWLSLRNHAGGSRKFEAFSRTNLTTHLASTTTKTGPTNGYYKYSTTVPASTAAFVHYFWFEPTVILEDAILKWESGIEMYTRSGSGRTNGFTGIKFWYQGDVGL
jgi:hypothetical protein